jgi:hypothetical protein
MKKIQDIHNWKSLPHVCIHKVTAVSLVTGEANTSPFFQFSPIPNHAIHSLSVKPLFCNFNLN